MKFKSAGDPGPGGDDLEMFHDFSSTPTAIFTLLFENPSNIAFFTKRPQLLVNFWRNDESCARRFISSNVVSLMLLRKRKFTLMSTGRFNNYTWTQNLTLPRQHLLTNFVPSLTKFHTTKTLWNLSTETTIKLKSTWMLYLPNICVCTPPVVASMNSDWHSYKYPQRYFKKLFWYSL